MIDPRHLPFNKLPPPVKIERVAADGRDLISDENQNSAHTIPGRSKSIMRPSVSVIPERVRFRYRLEGGHDRNWAERTPACQAFYNDLAPGHYVFHVTACNNNDGVWNWRGTDLAFTIPPTWYQTFVVSAYWRLFYCFFLQSSVTFTVCRGTPVR